MASLRFTLLEGVAENLVTHISTGVHRMTILKSQDTSPNWLIMNGEGFRGECMEGAKDLLCKHRPKIALEVHSVEEDMYVENALRDHHYKKLGTQKISGGISTSGRRDSAGI
jgi:hypothetical protein